MTRQFSVTKGVVPGLLVAATLCAACTPPDDEHEAKPTVAAARNHEEGIDDRDPIHVDAAGRFAVLAEMRTMLNAVQGIVGGAASGDTAAMRASAAMAGTALASESGHHMAAQLGEDFVQLGMRTHTGFDSLAADVAQGKSREFVLRRLANIMGNCVGCHNQYRLVVQP